MGRPSKYPEEFRREVVALRRSSERRRCQVAKDLGIADGTLAAWENEFPYGNRPEALDASERAELARLRKANAELKLDREILRRRPCISERVKGDETTVYADLMSASRLGSLIHATSGSSGGVRGRCRNRAGFAS